MADLAQKQVTLQAEFARLLQDPTASSAAIERAQREINRVAAQQTRLVAELRIARLDSADRFGGPGALAGQRPLRELVLDTLDELGVPAPPRVMSDFAVVAHGWTLPAERLASLRRDEERAYDKAPTTRPAWVVPAINALGLSAISRLVTHSGWELARRVIGTRTLRTNHLRLLLRLLETTERMQSQPGSRSGQLETLVVRFAESVPNALELGRPLDQARIRAAAEAEMARIEPSDLEERRTAAERLTSLPERFQLWGRPTLIDTGVELGRSSR
jgi:hypothetical protein